MCACVCGPAAVRCACTLETCGQILADTIHIPKSMMWKDLSAFVLVARQIIAGDSVEVVFFSTAPRMTEKERRKMQESPEFDLGSLGTLAEALELVNADRRVLSRFSVLRSATSVRILAVRQLGDLTVRVHSDSPGGHFIYIPEATLALRTCPGNKGDMTDLVKSSALSIAIGLDGLRWASVASPTLGRFDVNRLQHEVAAFVNGYADAVTQPVAENGFTHVRQRWDVAVMAQWTVDNRRLVQKLQQHLPTSYFQSAKFLTASDKVVEQQLALNRLVTLDLDARPAEALRYDALEAAVDARIEFVSQLEMTLNRLSATSETQQLQIQLNDLINELSSGAITSRRNLNTQLREISKRNYGQRPMPDAWTRVGLFLTCMGDALVHVLFLRARNRIVSTTSSSHHCRCPSEPCGICGQPAKRPPRGFYQCHL